MTRPHIKSIKCSECGEEVKNVGEDAVKVTCYSCVSKSMRNMPKHIDDDETEDDNN